MLYVLRFTLIVYIFPVTNGEKHGFVVSKKEEDAITASYPEGKNAGQFLESFRV